MSWGTWYLLIYLSSYRSGDSEGTF